MSTIFQAARGAPDRIAPLVSIRYDDDSAHERPLKGLRLSDFEWSVPWRTFRSVRGQTHHSGKYACSTTGGLVVHESRLELARLLLADFDPNVTYIRAQPFLLRAQVDGRMRRHVPDFLLEFRSGATRIVNVKPLERLQVVRIRAALEWPRQLVEQHGWDYEIWSGADHVVLENVRFLAAYRRSGVASEEALERAFATVESGESLASAERRLAGLGCPASDIRPALLALVWSGRLTTDLSRPLSGDWPLWRSA